MQNPSDRFWHTQEHAQIRSGNPSGALQKQRKCILMKVWKGLCTLSHFLLDFDNNCSQINEKAIQKEDLYSADFGIDF